MIYDFFYNLKRGTEHLNYGRDIVAKWCVDYANKIENKDVNVLDVGVGTGVDLLSIKQTCGSKNINLFGLEVYEPYIKKAKENKIKIFSINIENGTIPTKDEFFDIVIANQTLEHTKEIFWICSEISRVLKKDGIAVVGVPNMAALHNRILLLLGKQPSTIQLLSAHIRGFTKHDFEKFITTNDYFKVIDFKGSGFYPFPPLLSKTLSKIFPTLSVGIFYLIKRTQKKGKFIDIFKTRQYETPYFKGDEIDSKKEQDD
ncbi:Methyltransferase type 11 [groundwater metagenome]|uniref:Methyltransferase type 11 n=1 Tax=groundwater metagenome TaxID=717931 RepID=A0A098EBU9_9ZZZZ